MLKNQAVTAENLNTVMEFDHVIRVHSDGSVTDSPLHVYAELNVAPDGTDEFSLPEGWRLMSGYTGQYGYNGPVMHSSEFIGGRMARNILETPGDYVALIVDARCDYEGDTGCDVEQGCDCEPAGWAVAFKPAEQD